ncbi:TonB-dependent receptor [Sandaracinobacter sp. RS1-74]|uniref:TonB-dependent receptor domain-containing protein n=1 Tax=Sandaracinobacteroides sayramensis TaxID=2913411 RepID=UPI001EDC2634|nr:TonB-dependent receptor [Sandaracinobacteroides sayramensis]MCG2842648.1 TonB-dependent receptor [Sandaracinobacteroides sayramensis]
MMKRKARLLASTLIVGVGVGAMPALAQTTAEADAPQEIIVTGSRIQRTDLASVSPVTVVGQEEFQMSGAVNVEQVLNTLPQVLPGFTGNSNNPGNGAVTVNLRNLGTTRTLVLVNGRRWMFYNTSQIVDLNTIPQFMLEGVDVVTGGASAVYGSDAVAGVVNFRLRKDLEGVIAGATYSITGEGDGPRLSVDLGFGTKFADGNGHIALYANYTKREPIFQGARNFSRTAAGDGCIIAGSTNPSTGLGINLGGSTGTCVSRGGEIGLSPQGSGSTPIATLPSVGGGNGLIFNPSGGGTRPFLNPEDLYNYAPDNYLQLPQERYLIGGYASYEFSPGHELFTELSFVNNHVNQELAPTPAGVNAALQVNSPFFDAGTQAALAALDTDGDGYVTTTVGYRFNQSGARNALQNRNAFRVLGGVRGNITSNLQYEAFYSYARTQNTQYQKGNVSVSRYLAALSSEFGPDGQLRCRDAAARSAGCVPINVFGLGLADPAAIKYVTINSTNLEESSLKNAVGVISGTFGNLGLGADDLGFAIGAEYREMGASYSPDTYLASGDVVGFNAGQPTSGSYNATEIFGELRIPIISEGIVHRLELNGAARYSDYSLESVGGVWTYAAGVEFAPIRDIGFRGQYQRAVRAPNVEDLFGGQSVGFPAATDPCSDRGTPASRTDTLRQLCLDSGVPAANVFTRAVQPNAQIQGVFGGNPDLKEETSDTWTVGAVIQPRFAPGLNITVDYFNITVKDTISQFGGGLNSALSLCYTVVEDLSHPVCAPFVGKRNATTGALGATSGGGNPLILSANIGKLTTSGIDTQVDYTLPLGFSLFGKEESRLNFFFLGTYLDKFRSIPVASIPERETIAEGSVSTNPLPRWRHTARLALADSFGTLSVRWRYFGPIEDSRIKNTFSGLDRVGADPALLPNARVGAVNYFDFTFSADVDQYLTLTAGVNNLFNKMPEVLGAMQEQANTYPSTYDVLGRDFFISARLRF